jgi:hypothetical protein
VLQPWWHPLRLKREALTRDSGNTTKSDGSKCHSCPKKSSTINGGDRKCTGHCDEDRYLKMCVAEPEQTQMRRRFSDHWEENFLLDGLKMYHKSAVIVYTVLVRACVCETDPYWHVT